MTQNKTILLKCLVGSRAHGLHGPDSDYDYRGVHLVPTSDILRFDSKYSPTSWIEGKVDETSYELAHFLQLCTKANPSVLEVLVSHEVIEELPYAQEMRELLPYMYNPANAFDAFAGYSKNQQKKMLENHLDRRNKYGVAYVRTAFNLVALLKFGTFSLEVTDEPLRCHLENIKANQYSNGQILDVADRYLLRAKDLLPTVENKQDLNKINEFLLRVRKENW
jgi:predicted nucleotidyltransferase